MKAEQKNSGEKQVIEEAKLRFYKLEICKTVTNSIIVFSEVSKDHILPFIHPRNTH